ncbi:type-2 histone deacetylase 1 isoform X2 [Eurosta solidaginis]|uniref:type-2 histone deacetylase 1 isoform X2 n=1 Tax=Eurosta solidaginis TaxID=178769 RepID=UPI003531766B
MNSRNKRARLELAVGSTNIDAGIINGCPNTNNNQLTSSTGGTQSIFLGNAINTTNNNTDALSMLPTNVFLTICDENSNGSQDYLAIGSTFAHSIKQEHEEALSIGGSNVDNNSSSSTQSTQTMPLQYRVVDQTQRQLPNLENINNCSLNCNNTTSALNATLPMQLPNGCEIYIVKEYIDNMPTILTETELLQGPPSPQLTRSSTTAIKLESESGLTSTAINAATTTPSTAINGVQILRNTTLPCVFTTSKRPNGCVNGGRNNTNRTAVTVTTINGAAGEVQQNSAKRSCILEAFKKRDDKRRATHNEVERRRRDKINNWIFKLKEMLPTDSANNKNSNNNTQSSLVIDIGTAKTNANHSNNNSNNRTPPSDSKSQILIKACEYIKTMQDEIKGRRGVMVTCSAYRTEVAVFRAKQHQNFRNRFFQIEENFSKSGRPAPRQCLGSTPFGIGLKQVGPILPICRKN